MGAPLAIALSCRALVGIDDIDYSAARTCSFASAGCPESMGGAAPDGTSGEAGAKSITANSGNDQGGALPAGGKGGAGGAPATAAAGEAAGGESGNAGASNDYAQAVLADDPIAYYRFGEANGSLTAVDASGHGHDASYSKATLSVPGAIARDSDTACQLAGMMGSRIFAADQFDFAGTLPYTIELWMKPKVVDAQTRRLFQKAGTMGGYFAILSTSGIVAYRGDSMSNNMDVVGADGPFSQTDFTHVVLTYGATEMKLYVNGVVAASEPATIAIVDTSDPFVIGEGFGGVIDEFAIYDKALADARVREHYRVGSSH